MYVELAILEALRRYAPGRLDALVILACLVAGTTLDQRRDLGIGRTRRRPDIDPLALDL